jgi:hypothetical protein
MFLEEADIRALTKRRQRKLQREALAQMGIQHIVRPDGSLLVSKSHVEGLLSGLASANVEADVEIDWS